MPVQTGGWKGNLVGTKFPKLLSSFEKWSLNILATGIWEICELWVPCVYFSWGLLQYQAELSIVFIYVFIKAG